MSEPSIKTLLLPVDFTAPSPAAMRMAGEMATAFGAEVVLQYVIEPVRFPGEWTLAVMTRYIDIEPDLVKRANESLQQLAADAFPANVTARYRVDRGPAREMIIKAAEEEQAGLIVIASHSQSGVSHLVLGSTAEYVVRAAPCPVLTVRYD